MSHVVLKRELTIEDIDERVTYVHEMAGRWFQIGRKLKVSHAKLEIIKRDNRSEEECFENVPVEWLKRNVLKKWQRKKATWSKLIAAIEHSAVVKM